MEVVIARTSSPPRLPSLLAGTWAVCGSMDQTRTRIVTETATRISTWSKSIYFGCRDVVGEGREEGGMVG